MMHPRSIVRRFSLASLLLAVACGGNVAVETSGAAGGGGSDPGSSASTGSSGSTGSTGSSSGNSSTGAGMGGGGGAVPTDAVYSADGYSGGLDHIYFKKADPVRNICFRIAMAAPHGNAPGFAFSLPATWGISYASVSDKASDCDTPGGGANPVSADGGKGVVSFTVPPGGYFPCDVSVHGVLTFPAGPPWVPVQEPLDADMVPIAGGCF